MKNAYYIVTIHNKEDLIKNVIDGIVDSTSDSEYSTNIICVLDGCTDNSEAIIDTCFLPDDVNLLKLYEYDVHELLSLNSALKYINGIESDPEALIFLLQDDVVLDETDLAGQVAELYEQNEKLGYISFRCGMSTSLDGGGLLCEHSFVESEYGHWKQLNMTHFVEMPHHGFTLCETVIKSPTCIKKGVLDVVGLFDEKLAPFGHDDLDLCIRLNKLGYTNALYAAKFTSKVDWGGTREVKNADNDFHKRYNEIIYRNKHYLTYKHRDYYAAK